MFHPKLQRYRGILALMVWGGAVIALGLLRYDAYGIDETAARALLVSWTVVDRIVNPIVIMGAPDFRALVFLPLALYWPGSFVAMKIFMLLALFGAVALLFRWSSRAFNDETALIASGLTLIAPLAFMQVNAGGAGPFLLLFFGLGLWLNGTYRAKGKQLGGWYFAQLLLTVIAVSIHPAGLAYPLALAWEWHKNPVDLRQKKQFLIGLALASLFVLVMRFGWPALQWGINPLASLGDALMGKTPVNPLPTQWTAGIVPGLILAAVMYFNIDKFKTDLMARMLGIAVITGLAAADHSWTLIALVLVLYLGTPLLIRINAGFGSNSFAGQRGIVMAAVFIVATLFMLGDRAYRTGLISGTVVGKDEIIKSLVDETEDNEERFNTVSQWPGKTMLALKRPVFPLPPSTETPEELLDSLGDVSFLIFDPRDTRNRWLGQHIANLSGVMETLVQTPDGVIVKLHRDVAQPGDE